jgi:TRAP-type C4-dicarboxylate transport system permease small subunit
MDRLLKWIEVPMNLFMWVAMAAGALMMLHVVTDVLARWLLNAPLEGTAETVTYYYMVTVAYLPWMWLARNDGHIKVDFAVRVLPDRVNFWLDLAVKTALALYISLFAWQSWLYALRQTARNEVQQAGSFYLPVWPTRWLLPLAGGMMAAWLLLHVFDRIGKRVNGAA